VSGRVDIHSQLSKHAYCASTEAGKSTGNMLLEMTTVQSPAGERITRDWSSLRRLSRGANAPTVPWRATSVRYGTVRRAILWLC
jgi:hypothetical protein